MVSYRLRTDSAFFWIQVWFGSCILSWNILARKKRPKLSRTKSGKGTVLRNGGRRRTGKWRGWRRPGSCLHALCGHGRPSRQAQTLELRRGNLLDTLRVFNFHQIYTLLQEFVKELRMRPLNRHYFVLQTNPGEQFYLFTSLSAWLIRKCGIPFDQPQEFDDPNSTISNILDQLRKNGITIDFPPSKLKQVRL